MLPHSVLKDEPIACYAYPLSERDPLEILHRTYAAPEGEHPLADMHYALEIGITLSGVMRRFLGEGEPRDITPGDVWCCGMWELHGFSVTEAPCRVLVLVVWPPFVASLDFPGTGPAQWMAPFTVPAEQRPTIPAAQRPEVLALGERIAALCDGEDPRRALRLRLHTIELLALLQDALPPTVPPAPATSPEHYQRITPALELVFRSQAWIAHDVAAEACAMSADRFAQLFQQLMGISFAKFALRHRIQSAAHALLGMEEPVKAVAARWGFTDESHLHRLFVKHYGLSPAQFRARARRAPG